MSAIASIQEVVKVEPMDEKQEERAILHQIFDKNIQGNHRTQNEEEYIAKLKSFGVYDQKLIHSGYGGIVVHARNGNIAKKNHHGKEFEILLLLNEICADSEMRKAPNPHINLLVDYVGIDTADLFSITLLSPYAGIDLREFYHEKNGLQVDPDSLSVINSQVMDAISHLETLGLVHRDLKPENVLYDQKKKQVKIIDLAFMGRVPTKAYSKWALTNIQPPEMLLGLPCLANADGWAWGTCIVSIILPVDFVCLGRHPQQSTMVSLALYYIQKRVGLIPQYMIESSPILNQLPFKKDAKGQFQLECKNGPRGIASCRDLLGLSVELQKSPSIKKVYSFAIDHLLIIDPEIRPSNQVAFQIWQHYNDRAEPK